MFRKFRILILLLILATVGLNAWRTELRLTTWEHTVHVAVYPIAADDSPMTAQFIRDLNSDSLDEIAQWMQGQTQQHGLKLLQPISLRVAPPLTERPPLPPYRPSTSDAIWWSLKMRWWAWQHDQIPGIKPQIRLFVLFHDPARQARVPHSVGLGKGQIGLIHAFASRSQSRQNAVVITHELLHIFGASDKYDPGSLHPIYPQGYAEPERHPRLPQRWAEIMGGRTPITENQAKIPDNLSETVVGAETAREINWLRSTR